MNTSLLVKIFILALVSSSSFAQSQIYFYGYKTRYDLTTDSIEAIILPRSGRTPLKPNELLRVDDFLEALSINNRSESLVKLANKSALKRTSTDYDILPVFKHGNFPLIPTGEIVFKAKKGISYNQIYDYCDGQINFVKQTAYGTITVKPKLLNDLFKLANKIYESSLVEWCEPDFIVEIVKHQAITPTDQFYPQQYYLNQANNIDINAPQAWGLSRGINNVRVAVIDDGVEAHEDLNGRVVAGFTPTNQNGFGAPTNNPPPVEEGIIGHGQACAGIIGATHDNVGVAGVTPCTQIVPINIFNTWALDFNFPQGQRLRWLETAQDIAAGINWAWDPAFGNAQVLSNSWGYNTTDPNLIPQSGQIIQAINDARTLGRGGLGCIVVFASGNFHQQFSGVSFPANVDGVVTVGAINQNGNIWNYSSRGAQMDLVAPTGNVNLLGNVTTTDRMNGNGYEVGNYTNRFGGTSAACPQVSGVAALMLSINPALTEAQLVNILRNTATDMGSSGFDNTFGFGRLNAQAAIQQVLPTINGNALLCSTNSNYTLSFLPVNTTVTWSVTPTNLFATTGGASTTGTGGTASIRAVNSTASGVGTITFNIQGNCRITTITRTVWVGLPAEDVEFAIGFTNPVNEMTYWCSSHYGNIFTLDPVTPGATYEARLLSYPHLTVAHTNPNAIPGATDPFGYVAQGWYVFEVRIANGCGGLTWRGTEIEYVDCNDNYYFAVSPNPADSYLDIEMSDDIITETESYKITLVDDTGTEVLNTSSKNKKQRIDTSHLKNGQYVLRIQYNDDVTLRRIVIDR